MCSYVQVTRLFSSSRSLHQLFRSLWSPLWSQILFIRDMFMCRKVSRDAGHQFVVGAMISDTLLQLPEPCLVQTSNKYSSSLSVHLVPQWLPVQLQFKKCCGISPRNEHQCLLQKVSPLCLSSWLLLLRSYFNSLTQTGCLTYLTLGVLISLSQCQSWLPTCYKFPIVSSRVFGILFLC